MRPPRSDRDGGRYHLPLRDGRFHGALERARDATGDLDIKIGGGVSTVRQYLRAGLIDELHLAFSMVVLGQGEAMFEGLDFPELGYRLIEIAPPNSPHTS